jgi:aconitate hydratase
MLPLTFADPEDYERIEQDDRVAIRALSALSPNRQVVAEVTRPDGTTWSFTTNHSFSAQQIEWFRAGSALNIIRAST